MPVNTPQPYLETPALDDLWRLLRRELTSVPADPPLLAHLFQHCLAKLKYSLGAREEIREGAALMAAIAAYVEAHYAEPLYLEQVARQFHLSVSYLCVQFKRHYQSTLLHYQTRQRMLEAARLLQEGGHPTAEIAHRVGYDDVAYFSRVFTHYFQRTPGQVRRGGGLELFTAGLPPVRGTAPAEWTPVFARDFRDTPEIPPAMRVYWYPDLDAGGAQYPAAERLTVTEGALVLPPYPEWTNARWEDEISEEIKVEILAANPAPRGPNLALAISGDMHAGYRLRIYGYHHLEFETVHAGRHEVLFRCPTALDPRAPAYHLALWRVNNTFYAEIDGERVMEYYDPYASWGAEHRRFGLGQLWGGGSAILTLQVWKRQRALVGNALEPGRVMLWKGHRADARQWFGEALQEPLPADLYAEARYLLACTLPEEAPERLAALRAIAEDDHDRFSRFAWRTLIFTQLHQGRFAEAVEDTLTALARSADADLPQQVADKLTSEMCRLTPAHREEVLRLIAALPIAKLQLIDVLVPSLAPLRGRPLHELWLKGAGIADLSALTGMPLTALRIDNNAITDLSPLAGMALTHLVCSDNLITELTPLHGAPLHAIDCQHNAISELTPLAGLAICELCCTHNRIADLSPLTVTSLESLDCDENFITDLTPLRGAPLRALNCAANAISDLSPLRGMALSSLACSNNRIHDLTPLAGMPLEWLSCSGNPIVELSPLTDMPLTHLDIRGLAWHKATGDALSSLALRHLWCDLSTPAMAVIAGMPTLMAVNDHRAEYVHACWPDMARALACWRAAATPAPADLVEAMRRHATRLGEISYLSVPLQMTWEDAHAFAHWLGGTLPCPLNGQESRQFVAYLEEITLLVYSIYYALDLSVEVVEQRPEASYLREMLTEAELTVLREGRGYPCCQFRGTDLQWGVHAKPPYYLAITWREDPPRTMPPLPAPPRKTTGYRRGEPLQQATACLQEYLAEHPNASATEVLRHAATLGISARTLNRAKKQMHVLVRKRPTRNGGWTWRLPDEE